MNVKRRLAFRLRIIDWVVELKERDVAYAFLAKTLQAGTLNKRQIRNSLHALFKIGYHDRAADILKVFVDFAKHKDKSVRSEAVQLAIGLVKWASRWEKNPVTLSNDQKATLRESQKLGLSPKVARLAMEGLGD